MTLFPGNKAKGKGEASRLATIKDRLAAYMIGQLDEEDLTVEELKIFDRWTQIWSFLKNYHSPTQAVEAHLKMCEGKNEPISRRTAYRDLRYATDIWGNATKISKQAVLTLVYEYAIEAFKFAVVKKDAGEINRAVTNLIRLAKENEDFFENDHEGHTYVLELVTAGGQRKTINLDHLHETSKSDYHEIIDAVEEDEIDAVQMRKLLTGDSTPGGEDRNGEP